MKKLKQQLFKLNQKKYNLIMKYTIVEKEPINIEGIAIELSKEFLDNIDKINKLKKQFLEFVDGNPRTYGVQYKKDGFFSFIIGVDKKIGVETIKYEIPGGKYAVFEVENNKETLDRSYQEIFNTVIPHHIGKLNENSPIVYYEYTEDDLTNIVVPVIE